MTFDELLDSEDIENKDSESSLEQLLLCIIANKANELSLCFISKDDVMNLGKGNVNTIRVVPFHKWSLYKKLTIGRFTFFRKLRKRLGSINRLIGKIYVKGELGDTAMDYGLVVNVNEIKYILIIIDHNAASVSIKNGRYALEYS